MLKLIFDLVHDDKARWFTDNVGFTDKRTMATLVPSDIIFYMHWCLISLQYLLTHL